MTPQEAIRRIKDHNEVHSRKEKHFAVYITEALNMACEALEKQIPKKPLWGGTNNASWRSCPECHSKENKTHKYCSQCGQKLSWESDTE